MTSTVLNTKIKKVDNKILELNGLVKKQMTLEHRKSKKTTLLPLIIMNLRVKYLMQR